MPPRKPTLEREEIAERIADAVASRGSQADLARALGLSEAAVSQWQRRGGLDAWVRLRRICEVAEVSADWLLGLSDRRERQDEDALAVIRGGLDRLEGELARLLEENQSLRARLSAGTAADAEWIMEPAPEPTAGPGQDERPRRPAGKRTRTGRRKRR